MMKMSESEPLLVDGDDKWGIRLAEQNVSVKL